VTVVPIPFQTVIGEGAEFLGSHGGKKRLSGAVRALGEGGAQQAGLFRRAGITGGASPLAGGVRGFENFRAGQLRGSGSVPWHRMSER
jgi:hypothetical protein